MMLLTFSRTAEMVLSHSGALKTVSISSTISPINGFNMSEAEELAEEAALEELVLADERKRRVNAALARLPEDMRGAVQLIYWEEMTYAEAAKVMGKNRKQVDNLLYRAKKELCVLLREEGEPLQ